MNTNLCAECDRLRAERDLLRCENAELRVEREEARRAHAETTRKLFSVLDHFGKAKDEIARGIEENNDHAEVIESLKRRLAARTKAHQALLARTKK